MNEHDEFTGLAHAWLQEGPTSMSDRSIEAALEQVQRTRQRRALPSRSWRFPALEMSARMVMTAVAVMAIGLVGLFALGPPAFPGGVGSVGSPTPGSTSVVTPSLPDLSESFTSAINGYSIAYPSGWTISAATQPRPILDRASNPDDPWVDVLEGGAQSVYIESYVPPAGTSPQKWIARMLARRAGEGSGSQACGSARTEPVVVDGTSGVLDLSCPMIDYWATVSSGGRVYEVRIQADLPDRELFLELLLTIKLHPENARDAAPSPPPS